MRILRLILGLGVMFVVLRIGLEINYIYAGVLIVIGAILIITSFGKDKQK